MNKKGALVVVGSANMDMVVSTGRFPDPGETILGEAFRMFPGGKGANQAVSAAKLGGRVSFIGKMGNDLFRDRLFESMGRDGVCLDYVLSDPDVSTGIAVIMVDSNGMNEIVVVSGSNMRLSPDDIEKMHHIIAAAGVVLMQLEIPVETVLKTTEIAKENGAVVILNPAPARELPESLLRKIDILTPNENEAEYLSGIPVDSCESARAAATALLARGVGSVIVTMGDKGCVLVSERVSEIFPAPKVQAVDSTAAGDAFNGALALSLGMGKTISEAIRFATTVAAISVTRMGAQSSMPTLEDVHSFLAVDTP
jgi:ribokinase